MRKKLFTLLIILFTYSSCIKDIEFNYNEVGKQVVVNALFSENEPWKVLLCYSKATEDTTDKYVDNAVITIHSEKEVVLLEYAGDGEYKSVNSPRVGDIYTITVNVPGFETITATSSVPQQPQAEIEPFDTIWTKYMFPNDLLDYEVLPFTVNLGSNKEQYYKFGFSYYIPEYRFYVTPEVVENLRNKGIPDDMLEVLAGLYGQYFWNQYLIAQHIRQFISKYSVNYSEYENIVLSEIIKERISEYTPDRFFNPGTFSNCDWLSNISSYTKEVVGENDNKNTAEIFLGDPNLAWAMQVNQKNDKEYWLKIDTCSPEFYKYYKTYVLQVSQSMNPYAEPIKVYSNIENGLGIFAGYNRQMIHFFDY